MAVAAVSLIFFVDCHLHLPVYRDLRWSLTPSHRAEIVLVMLAAEDQYGPCIISPWHDDADRD
jgi:hypothetical protein